MITEYITTSGTAYFAFALNDPADGSAADADSPGPLAFVRAVGATATNAAITTGVTVSLLSDSSYPLGCYEVSVSASTASLTAGAKYTVYVSATVNGTTSVGAVGHIVVNELLSAYDVGILFKGAIDTVNSQVSFDIDTPQYGDTVTDDSWIGNVCTIEDVTTGEIVSTRITDVDQTNNRIIIEAPPVFTVATNDIVRVYRDIHPIYALNTYDPPTRTEATTDKNSILDRVQGFAQLMARSDAFITADRSAELALINNDEGSGAGTFSNQTDSLEANTALINGLNDIAASQVWAHVLGSTTMTASALLQIVAGVAAGKLSGADTVSVTIRNIEDDENMIVATVDSNGNRSALTINTPST